MNVKPDQSVGEYVRQIEQSLRTSGRRHGLRGLDSSTARKARLKYWSELAREAGVSTSVISRVNQQLKQKYGD